MARMIGYVCQPFCGKSCCRDISVKRRAEKRLEKKRIKAIEKRTWKREI